MSSTSIRRFFGPLGWLLLLPSAFTALGAAWLIATGMNVVGDMRSAKGHVVAHQTVSLAQGRGMGLHSVVKFTAHDGRSMEFVDSLARQHAAVHTVGEIVNVRYPVDDPSQAQISGSAWIKTIIGVVLLIFSSIGVLVGWLLLRLRHRAEPTAAAS